jgi:glycosyltransferase involved in cell wall biosynthesis
MKIAVFSDTFDQTNGVAVTIQHLVKYAEEKSIHIDVFTQGEKESIEIFGSARVFRFKPVMPIKFYSELYFDLILPHKKMLELAKSENYDLILSVAIGSFGINAMIIAKRLGISIAAEYNTDVPKYILPRIKETLGFLPDFMHNLISLPMEAILRKYISFYYKRCDLVFTVSNYNKRELEDLIQREVKIFSRGVDTENFSPLKRDLDLKKKYKAALALYVGRISVDKNVQILIDIFKNREDLRLVLVGDGPYKEEMQKMLPSAIFTGPVYDREKLAKIYASCDFFVFPSETETFGQVIT